MARRRVIYERLGARPSAEPGRDDSKDGATYEVYVPPAAGPEGKYGLFVWVSPNSSGQITDADILPILDAAHLIWIGANDSGNPRPRVDRIRLALAILFPEVFRGAILSMGVDFWRPVPSPQKPGSSWAAAFAPPPASTLATLRERARLVMVTGQYDLNRFQTRANYRTYRDEGFKNVTYLEIPELGHFAGFGAAAFRDALAALEAPPHA